MRSCSRRSFIRRAEPDQDLGLFTCTMSVWDGVNRAELWQNLRLLTKTAKFQSISRLPKIELHREPLRDSEGSALPPSIECQLADDFAFLTSVTTDPRSVAAAAVHSLSDPPRLVITLAANGGIPDHISEQIRRILDTLQNGATRQYSKHATMAACRNLIVALHTRRIFDRLIKVKVSVQIIGHRSKP